MLSSSMIESPLPLRAFYGPYHTTESRLVWEVLRIHSPSDMLRLLGMSGCNLPSKSASRAVWSPAFPVRDTSPLHRSNQAQITQDRV